MNFLFVLPDEFYPSYMWGFMRSGIAYVAASLKKHGYNVHGLNLSYVDDTHEAIKSSLKANEIDCVCIGALSAEYNYVEYICKIAKEVNPKIITIGGGG